ncbi:MAG: tyrosine-protein phosphatase [Candidatus Limnocylindrales bacterium]
MTLTDTPTTRVLDWEGCFNVRDLGGLTTAGGQRVRWGALVRADLLARLTESGRQSLLDHGVRTIVDLRFPDEVAKDWEAYPFKDTDETEHGVRYANVPFNTGRDPQDEAHLRAAYASATTRLELNRHDIDWHPVGIATAVAAIADAREGGVLVHCHAGKDRTGAVVGLVLSALGVPDEDIAEDYAMTALTLEPLIVEWLDSHTQDPDERERMRALAMPVREAMLDTLSYVREKHGSAEEFLINGGVTRDHLAALRARLLVEVE